MKRTLAMKRKRVVVLGATGSIGESAAKVARDIPERVEIVGIAANSKARELAAQANELRPGAVCIVDETKLDELRTNLNYKPEIFWGEAGLREIASKVASDMVDYKPEIIFENARVMEVDPRDDEAIARVNDSPEAQLVTVKDDVDLPLVPAFRLLAAKLQSRHPILLKDVVRHPERSEAIPPVRLGPKDPVDASFKLTPRDPSTSLGMTDFLTTLLTASTNIGSLLCDGIGDAILVQGEEAPGQSLRLSYNILQAAGSRIFKTDYVACPSCGRTLFNLQITTAKIKAATVHLKGVKIAIMCVGWIISDPGGVEIIPIGLNFRPASKATK